MKLCLKSVTTKKIEWEMYKLDLWYIYKQVARR